MNDEATWIVCLRLIPANEDEYLGPFHSEERADKLADRLNNDIEAVGATHLMEATVHQLHTRLEHEDIRDTMLRDLEEMGYAHPGYVEA